MREQFTRSESKQTFAQTTTGTFTHSRTMTTNTNTNTNSNTATVNCVMCARHTEMFGARRTKRHACVVLRIRFPDNYRLGGTSQPVASSSQPQCAAAPSAVVAAAAAAAAASRAYRCQPELGCALRILALSLSIAMASGAPHYMVGQRAIAHTCVRMEHVGDACKRTHSICNRRANAYGLCDWAPFLHQ